MTTVKQIARLEDLQPDRRNANAGTERGLGLLEHSLHRYGAGRSILADRQGRIIAGNKTLEKAVQMGLGIKVVQTHGDELVVVQRVDLDLEDADCADARELGVADNRVAEVDLEWNPEVLKALQGGETDLAAFWTDSELADILDSKSKRREHVEFEADRSVCVCCRSKCRRSCGCFRE